MPVITTRITDRVLEASMMLEVSNGSVTPA
jgi:hypothetical protein